jgi:hypothetical protein
MAVVGLERPKELFESAYDEHGHRLAKLYAAVVVLTSTSANRNGPTGRVSVFFEKARMSLRSVDA